MRTSSQPACIADRRPRGTRTAIAKPRGRLSNACAIWFLLSLIAQAWSTDFYVSPTGSDGNSGSSAAPWQSIAKVNAHAFVPGDRILFQGGQTFAGDLSFDASDAGTTASPVVVSSYGAGRATISATSTGLYAYNCAGFEVRNLIVTGPGASSSTSSGVSFYTDLGGGVTLSHVLIDHVDVSGFREGITIGSWNSSLSGFGSVTVTNCACHDNSRAGMSSYGYFTATTGVWSHHGWYVGHCTFANNLGDPTFTANHSGSGIVLGEVDGVVIERCVASGNGSLSAHIGGGPVGIWAYDSNNVTIQYCESHDNHCGQSVDGGGFDLDGGSTNSLMQYNWSHDNDGAGYLVGDYGGSRPTSTNVVRYNVSQNDGRRNSYAGVYVYAGSDCTIYNNTLFTSPASSSSPECLHVSGGSNTRAWNNILISTGGARLINVNSSATLQGNDYWASGGTFVAISNGTTYGTLAALHGVGIERLNGADVGLSVDPLLTAPGSGPSYDNADSIIGLSAYRLQSGSPMIDAGLDVATLFAMSPGPHDFFDITLPQGSGFDVGAHERAASVAAPVISSSGNASGTVGVAFSYTITASNSPTSFNATGLPGGLSIDTATGVISGTPTASGTSTVTLSATNAGGTGSASLTLTIAAATPAAPVISSSGTASGTVGVAFSYTITATNSPTSFNATGLPSGLSINTTTGVISGTPTASGTSTVTLSATNAGGTGSSSLTLTITAASTTLASPVRSNAGSRHQCGAGSALAVALVATLFRRRLS